ncbi:MAG: heme-binding protein [Steroidobacteraceae bacterium]
MKRTIPLLLSAVAVVAMSASAAFAADSGNHLLPGDHGRSLDGILPTSPPPLGQMPRNAAHAPAIALAVEAAEAIAEGCKQYPLGIAVVDAAGAPILVYLPDGSEPRHGYTAIRKAYTAVAMKSSTTSLVVKAQQDPEFAAQIKADPNLMAFHGGLLLKVGDQVIGAIGVSGAEPGGHDDECGLIGLNKIQSRLK